MTATITIAKSALSKNPEILNEIEKMVVHVIEMDDRYAFHPKAGHLYELLNYLKDTGVNYTTHFS